MQPTALQGQREASNERAIRRPFRVLCLDGGGMRGVYTATFISRLSEGFSKNRGVGELDLGAGFNLIVGTSTGAIIGCALAVGVAPKRVIELYRTHGSQIFPRKLPSSMNFGLLVDILCRKSAVKSGESALRRALTQQFQDITIAEVYLVRQIALAIPAVDIATHRSWVFKTPHLLTTNHRDDDVTLVDACLATSAAPLFRSLAVVSGAPPNAKRIFADGGLWANNPVLVALIEALQLAPPDQPIQIFCLGTCPLPAGEDVAQTQPHRGLFDWKFGGEAAKLAIDAQEFAFDNMAKMLARHVSRECAIVRFPRKDVPASLMKYLDLDDTRAAAADALGSQASTDADLVNSICSDPNDSSGRLIKELFMGLPELSDAPKFREEKHG